MPFIDHKDAHNNSNILAENNDVKEKGHKKRKLNNNAANNIIPDISEKSLKQ